MLDTKTRDRNKIIGDAFAEYEVNRKSASRFGSAEDYVNEVLREHDLPPLDDSETKGLFSRARTDAINKACNELKTHENLIACSRREYIDETLRGIGQPGITDEEHREFNISA